MLLVLRYCFLYVRLYWLDSITVQRARESERDVKLYYIYFFQKFSCSNSLRCVKCATSNNNNNNIQKKTLRIPLVNCACVYVNAWNDWIVPPIIYCYNFECVAPGKLIKLLCKLNKFATCISRRCCHRCRAHTHTTHMGDNLKCHSRFTFWHCHWIPSVVCWNEFQQKFKPNQSNWCSINFSNMKSSTSKPSTPSVCVFCVLNLWYAIKTINFLEQLSTHIVTFKVFSRLKYANGFRVPQMRFKLIKYLTGWKRQQQQSRLQVC